VTFEDGRKGTMAARLRIHDMAAAGSAERAA
jgi:hypothetical protein